MESVEQRYLLSGWTLQTLANFAGDNGATPTSSLAMDSSGDLYGTTERGGSLGDGSVFEWAKGSSAITILASFGVGGATQTGMSPLTGVVVDAEGNVYGTTAAGGSYGSGTIFEIAKGSGTVTTLASIASNQMVGLQAGLTIGTSGNLYGTTNTSVFEIASGSDTLTVLATFNGANGSDSDSPLLLDSAGNLYGSTLKGGPSGDGVVFEIAKGSDSITDLAGGGSEGAMVRDPSGDLYGADGGGVFELPNGSNTMIDLASFADGTPAGGLTIDPAGNLYGTDGGGIFEVVKGSNVAIPLVTLVASDGSDPRGPLVMDQSGHLYGDMSFGGADQQGTVFELSTNTSVSVARTSGSNPSPANDQLTFTATVAGGVSDGETVLLQDASDNDAYLAAGVLVNGSATLTVLPNTLSVGTHDVIVSYGGDATHGASFSAPSAQVVTTGSSASRPGQGGSGPVGSSTAPTPYILTNRGDFSSSYPSNTNSAVTLDSSGNIYGTTSWPSPGGSVYEIAKGSNTITTLVTFTQAKEPSPTAEPPDDPNGGLVIDSAGNLYGITEFGGAYNDGAVFEIARGSNAVTTLASFDIPQRFRPQQSLTIDAAGNLYGTSQSTVYGLANGSTVFELAKGSSTLTILGTFNMENGYSPDSPLILDAAGNLYGTTEGGGAYGEGTVYEVAKGSKTITDLAAFNGTEGAQPMGNLAMDPEGNLYGLTYSGDPVIFELAKGSDTITVLARLIGANPEGGVTLDAAGNLYGTTSDGGGSVFELTKEYHSLTNLYSFNGTIGGAPVTALTLDATGNIYGTTSGGGVDNGGYVFELTPNASVSVALATGSNPAATNEQVTYTATITGDVPDGETVLLEDASDNDAYIAAGVIVNGSATLTILPDTLSVGTHDLIVVYAGDATHGATTSAPFAQIITASTARPGHGP